MARLHIHPIGLVLIFVGLVTWVIALGGMGAATKYCHDVDTISNCSQKYQLEWWSIWFEFFLLIIMLATCFLNAFERARFIYLSYLALVTSLLTIMARNCITRSFKVYYSSDPNIDTGNTISDIPANTYNGAAMNAAAAGSIMLCVTNYALIIFIGLGAAAAQGVGQNMQAEQKYQPSNF